MYRGVPVVCPAPGSLTSELLGEHPATAFFSRCLGEYDEAFLPFDVLHASF